MIALLSIKPKWADMILNGSKKFEFRKKCFKNNVNIVLLYATKPIQKIVGEFKVAHVLKNKIDYLHEHYFKLSGLTENEFTDYFKDHTHGHVIIIGDTVRYTYELDPYYVFRNFKPPQNFMYVRNSDLKLNFETILI